MNFWPNLSIEEKMKRTKLIYPIIVFIGFIVFFWKLDIIPAILISMFMVVSLSQDYRMLKIENKLEKVNK